VKKIDNLNHIFQDSSTSRAGFDRDYTAFECFQESLLQDDRVGSQTPSAASSGRRVFDARHITTSASSRCDFDDSFRSTFKDGNANTGPGEADPGNLGRGTRTSKACSDPRADAECRRTRNSRAESKTN
jgi:hypothetical protein